MTDNQRMRIAIGGIHIESSTFTRHITHEDGFAVRRGQELLDAFPVAEWLGEELDSRIEWVPTLHALAGASGPVDPATFDAFEDEIIAGLEAAGPLDGVWLPLHGAMNVLGRDGAEEHLVRRVRETVGPDVILSASMDPHGNLSHELASLLDLAACHRHAPHIDNALTRERAVVNLVDVITSGRRPHKAWVRIPSLLPGERTSTVVEPGATVFGALLPAIEKYRVIDANTWIGFAWADEPRNSAAVLVTAWDADTAIACARELAELYWDARERFIIVTEHSGSLDEAWDLVVDGAPTPVFVTDSGDNVTAGGTGDVTVAMHSLLARPDLLEGRRILVAGLIDPLALEAATVAGEGSRIELALGASLDDRYAGPVNGMWTVERLVRSTDASRVNAALLVQGSLSVSVQWARDPFVAPDDAAIQAGLTLGAAWIDPSGYDVVVVKNGYPFPSQVAHAGTVFLAMTPGGTDLDFDRLPIHRWSRPMFPLDRDFAADLTPVIL